MWLLKIQFKMVLFVTGLVWVELWLVDWVLWLVFAGTQLASCWAIISCALPTWFLTEPSEEVDEKVDDDDGVGLIEDADEAVCFWWSIVPIVVIVVTTILSFANIFTLSHIYVTWSEVNYSLLCFYFIFLFYIYSK